MMQTEQELNQQVLSLTKQGKYQSAADVISDWLYWDMVGRWDEEPPAPAPVQRQDDRVAGGSMKGQLEDRLNEEFGKDGWKA